MIKTLKITSFLVAVLALGVLIFVAARGMAADPRVENLLKTPGVAEKLQTGSAGPKSIDADQETPLVRQAKAFALRINPPPPPAPPVARERTSELVRPKATVTAKFKLLGTSYHFGDEADSWALIDEVGKGLHWARQGSKVGHLIIEKIGDGSVLINDNEKRYELVAEREQKPDLVKSYTGKLTENEPIVLWQGIDKKQTSAESVTDAPQTPATTSLPTETSEPVAPPVSQEQVRDSVEWVKKLRENPEALGMTPEEANELGDLGEFLKSVESELKPTADVNASSQQPAKTQNIEKDDEPNPDNEPRPLPRSSVRRRIAPPRSRKADSED